MKQPPAQPRVCLGLSTNLVGQNACLLEPRTPSPDYWHSKSGTNRTANVLECCWLESCIVLLDCLFTFVRSETPSFRGELFRGRHHLDILARCGAVRCGWCGWFGRFTTSRPASRTSRPKLQCESKDHKDMEMRGRAVTRVWEVLAYTCRSDDRNRPRKASSHAVGPWISTPRAGGKWQSWPVWLRARRTRARFCVTVIYEGNVWQERAYESMSSGKVCCIGPRSFFGGAVGESWLLEAGSLECTELSMLYVGVQVKIH